jgi:hypothetical protein
MIKRLLILVALGTMLIACNPSNGGASPDTQSVAPIESVPAESMMPSASPS